MDSVKIYTETQFPTELKWDSSFRLLFLLKGNLSIHVGTAERHLYPHDFTFIQPFEIYGSCSSNDSRALILRISPDLWKSLCPNADELSFSLRILKANDDTHSAYSSICKSLAQIIHYNSSGDLNSPARICRSISEIFAILLEDFAESQSAAKPMEQTSYRIQNILRYISENYARRFSLEEIAGEIGFHPQYFSSYFKKQFGTNFTDYLNAYRVNKSTIMLRESGESILNIALACGFNNHKTFSNAFEKVYGCSPRDYKKGLYLDTQQSEFNSEEDDFDYLRRFWSQSEQDFPLLDQERLKCNILIQDDHVLFRNKSHNIVSIGRAISCLRSDLQEQLRKAKRDLNLEYARIRDVFSDDLFVYYEDSNKTPVFSFRALDEIFDFLMSIQIKPFIEIGYMPEQLASKKQYAGWQYHPNVSSPKSMKFWEQLVSSFVDHLIQRYGKDQVDSWLFDFWTSPNLDVRQGYWNDSMERFFQFYESTWHAVKRISRNIWMGSPNFSYTSGMPWYEQFYLYAGRHHIRPDFISIHLYGCTDGQDATDRVFMRYSSFDNNFSIPNIRPEQDTIPRAIEELRRLTDNYGFSSTPIVIDDWSVTFFPTDYTRDTCFMAPYVADNYFNSCKYVFGMGYASLSDIHEDFFNTDQLYNGGPGLLTYNGIPKASYQALAMSYRFSHAILQKGNNYIVGKTDSGYEILVYNMSFYNDSYIGNDPSIISFKKRYNVFQQAHDMDCHIELSVGEGSYSIITSSINRKSGSSYDIWVQMGSPVDSAPGIAEYLKQISTPKIKYQIRNVSGNLILDEVLEPHEVIHIAISRISDQSR